MELLVLLQCLELGAVELGNGIELGVERFLALNFNLVMAFFGLEFDDLEYFELEPEGIFYCSIFIIFYFISIYNPFLSVGHMTHRDQV